MPKLMLFRSAYRLSCSVPRNASAYRLRYNMLKLVGFRRNAWRNKTKLFVRSVPPRFLRTGRRNKMAELTKGSASESQETYQTVACWEAEKGAPTNCQAYRIFL